jgi:uncharacterized protein (DUF488 family)
MREFLHVLRAYQIEHVVDTRRFPTSRYTHFNREQLKTASSSMGSSTTTLRGSAATGTAGTAGT